jgi:RNA polymerase sigma factor (sigma-70 family)
MTTPTHDSDDLVSRSLSHGELPDPRHSLELLALAQNGDRRALEDLVSRYQDRIRRIVRIQLGASDLRRQYDSMDIVQSTFKAALPKIGDLQPRSAAGLLQWLALIATNKIRDAHDRQRAAKRNVALEVPIQDDTLASDRHPNLAVGGTAPDEQALLQEVRDLLDDEVGRLPDDQRRVVILRDYCGDDWEHIAAELDRGHGATRQLHQRAWISLRRALRPKLKGRPSGPVP